MYVTMIVHDFTFMDNHKFECYHKINIWIVNCKSWLEDMTLGGFSWFKNDKLQVDS